MINNDLEAEITEEEFNEIINNSHEFVIVDFFAEWCLSPNTSLIFNPIIKTIKNVHKGSKILSFDENFNESYANVKTTHNVIHNKKIKIITKRGREIECTPEHLLLTREGFKNAQSLEIEDEVATYLFSTYPTIKENKKLFLTEKKIRQTAKKLNLLNEKFIDELKEKNLLNICYDNEKAHILASLVGLALSNGSLSAQKNSLRSIEFFINERDVNEVLKDLKFIGYSGSVRKQKIIGKINDREFIQKRIRVSKTSLFILLNCLGAIEGKKFIKGLKIPEWIIKGPKEIQRSFLQGLLGGDGPKIEIRTIDNKKRKFYNKTCINPIEFHFYSDSKNSPKKFSENLIYLLKNLGVVVRKSEIKKEERYKRKDGKTSLLLKIYLNTNLKSAYAYASIGFKYAYNKKITSSIAREYLNERMALQKKTKENKTGNWSNISYMNWVKQNINGNIAYDKIKKIEIYEGEKFPFISISLDNKTKMFVANEIVQHNCMPCLMLSPIIDELSEKMPEVKFTKVNIDDNKELAQKYKISSIPCLIIFKDGKEIDRIIGMQSSEDIEQKIKSHL